MGAASGPQREHTCTHNRTQSLRQCMFPPGLRPQRVKFGQGMRALHREIGSHEGGGQDGQEKAGVMDMLPCARTDYMPTRRSRDASLARRPPRMDGGPLEYVVGRARRGGNTRRHAPTTIRASAGAAPCADTAREPFVEPSDGPARVDGLDAETLMQQLR